MNPYFSVNIKLRHKKSLPSTRINMISMPPYEKKLDVIQKSAEHLHLLPRNKYRNRSKLRHSPSNQTNIEFSTSSSPTGLSYTPEPLISNQPTIIFKKIQIRRASHSNLAKDRCRVMKNFPAISPSSLKSKLYDSSKKSSWALDLSSETYKKHAQKLKYLFKLN